MPASAEQSEILYSVFEAHETDELARLLADIFSRREPPAVALGLTCEEFESFVRLLCPHAAAARLTIVARHADTGEMVGALLTEDSASSQPHGMDGLSSKFGPIFDLLGGLDADYRRGRTVQHGESLHLYLLGVAEAAGGRGIAKQLVAKCVENGTRKGYRVAVTEATAKTSQHVFRTLGFTERAFRSYAEHRFDGRAMFASIAEHGGPMLMERSLTA